MLIELPGGRAESFSFIGSVGADRPASIRESSRSDESGGQRCSQFYFCKNDLGEGT